METCLRAKKLQLFELSFQIVAGDPLLYPTASFVGQPCFALPAFEEDDPANLMNMASI